MSTSAPSEAGTSPNQLQLLREAICKMEKSQVRQALLTLINAADDNVNELRTNIEAWYDSTMDRVAGWYKRRIQVMLFIIGIVLAIATNADTITITKSLSQDNTLRASLVSITQEYAKSRPDVPSDNPQQRVKDNLNLIQSYGLPLGWNRADPRMVPNTWEGWSAKAVGWLLTAAAISLGAPFWFDLLNKITVIRSTVKPHEKSPEEPSEDQ
jgi:hypothetical protein